MNSENDRSVAPNRQLEAWWMPFTSNRAFKDAPRIIRSANGHYYVAENGDKILDAFSGLWTSGLGHCHPKIVEAITDQLKTLDFAASFQVGHSRPFELATRLVELAPEGFTHCFFTNSGSESADTALKIALGYHKARGDEARTHFVGRERGYHGVNFGGMSVGGIPANRHMFAASLLPNVSHLPTTYSLEHQAFSRGQPDWGIHLADNLDQIADRIGGGHIAAVMVEPVAGSTGILPPPVGYLERLRELCTKHGTLLIFDEVITAFGRVGAPFGAERFGVTPDIICTAKGITNGVIPMGAVLVREGIYEAFMSGPPHMVEFFHGYTYSGHPVAAAAGLATLDVYQTEGTFEAARSREQIFEDGLHSLADADHVIDIRNFGLMGAVELAPRDGAVGKRGLDVHIRCFESGLLVRSSGDILQFSPFFDSTIDEFAQTFETVRRVLASVE